MKEQCEREVVVPVSTWNKNNKYGYNEYKCTCKIPFNDIVPLDNYCRACGARLDWLRVK
jgi:hypothetical protein